MLAMMKSKRVRDVVCAACCNCDTHRDATAYKKQALKWHPDRNSGNTKAAEKFKEVGD